jgi:general secretion pathway protein D
VKNIIPIPLFLAAFLILGAATRAGCEVPSAGAPEKQASASSDSSGLSIAERVKIVKFPRLCFDAMPLGQALETLSSMADAQGMPVNIIRLAPKGDDPKVTLSLRNVNLDRALYYVAQSINFTCELESDAIVLRPASQAGGALRTEFFPMNRSALVRMAGIVGAKPENNTSTKAQTPDIGPTPLEIEKAVRSFLERAGVPFDPVPGATLALGSEQLIVTNTPGNLDKVRAVLLRYQTVRQVEIEAQFLEVAQSDLDEFGVAWGLSNAANVRGSKTSVALGSSNRTLATSSSGTTTTDQIVITGLDSGTITQTITAPTLSGSLNTGSSSSSAATIGGVINSFDISAVVTALSQKSDTNLMSAPKLTVLSGERAEITVAQEFIYPRSYGDATSNVSRGSSTTTGSAVSITSGTPRDFTKRNVGVEMGVTATVEEDNSISMILEPSVTEFEGFVEYGGPSIAVLDSKTATVPSGYYQPVFNVRKIRTEVTVADGATIVMGGLTREETISVKDKVPILGDIPLFGRLFRDEGESSQKKDLLIFVTAHIIGKDGVPLSPIANPTGLLSQKKDEADADKSEKSGEEESEVAKDEAPAVKRPLVKGAKK